MTDHPLKKFLGMPRLDREFFAQDTLVVARELVGKLLVVGDKAVIIAETEAYIGTTDLASHARFGKTTRNSIMWEKPGQLYIFLVYGMHLCVNIVTEAAGSPAAVLLRGGVAVAGIASGIKLDGPGKFTKALGMTKQDQGVDLAASSQMSLQNIGLAPHTLATPRIGIDYAGSWAAKPWRFVAQFTQPDLQKGGVSSAAPLYMRRTA